MGDNPEVIYWDASAVLSTLFRDAHSDTALRWVQMEGFHLLSSLAHAEVSAVIARMKKESILSDALVDMSFEALSQGPWRRLRSHPDWSGTEELARKWSLRGADLWHLSAARSLKEELPELVLLTFDARLGLAVQGEGLAPGEKEGG